jgi:dipeptidyl aminopeptidase/acylaminoacyl peptidase
MKQKYLISSLAAAACIAAAANSKQVVISSYKAAQPIPIVLPAMSDSTDATGTKFTVNSLLKNPANLDLKNRAGVSLLSGTDSLSTVQVPTTGDRSLTILETRLRAQHFAKGRLVVTTPEAYQIYVDGQPSDGQLTLQPEQTTVVSFKVLSAPNDSVHNFSAVFKPDSIYADIDVAVDPNMKQRFSHRSTYQGLRVKSTYLSADGKYLITNYAETFTPDKTTYYRELSEAATGRVITRNIRDNANWMPQNSRLYYTVQGDTGYDLIVVDVPSMAETVVARNIPDNYFYWAPDESFIIYYARSEATKVQGPLQRYRLPDDRIPGNRDRSYLMRYDLATGVSTPLAYGGDTPYYLDITPDSKRVLYSVTHQTPAKFPFYHTDLVELDLATLATDTIVSNNPSIKSAIYSPDGKKLFITGGPESFGKLGKNCDAFPIANDYDVQGYIFDIASRTPVAATYDFDPSLAGQAVWNRADNQIYFQAESDFRKLIYRLNPSTLKITQLPTEIDRITAYSIGNREASWLSYSGESTEYAGRAYLLNLRKSTNRLIADPLAPMLEDIEMGTTDSWKFTAEDGTTVDGIFTLPPDFDPNKKYPMIVYYYGGTLPTYKGMSHPYVPELFASRGYVVYMPNPSGTVGYGQDYSARHVNAWGEYTANEIIQGVKKFIAEHPYVDAAKVGCIGASYGGFMTQYLLAHTDIFAAGVSHAGISNIASYWGEGYWGYSYNTVAAAGKYPWTDRDLFAQGSLANADKIHTPLLLLHGTVDTNVPIGESIQLFNALRILDRPVEFVTVDGENHYIGDLKKQSQWHATIMAWFARWLQDDPRWWSELYPN